MPICCNFPPNQETWPCSTSVFVTCLPRSLISCVFCVLYNPDPDPYLPLDPNHNPNPVPNFNLQAKMNVTLTLTEEGQKETGRKASWQNGNQWATFQSSVLKCGWLRGLATCTEWTSGFILLAGFSSRTLWNIFQKRQRSMTKLGSIWKMDCNKPGLETQRFCVRMMKATGQQHKTIWPLIFS